MIIEIKSISGRVLYSAEARDVREALEKAVAARADLARANLAGANLADANLVGADLARADLARANLAGANLADANLVGADLARADLARANLARADLAGANLVDANLVDAYLADANLVGALEPIRSDICAVLAAAPAEVPGLLAALRVGKIDGSVYRGDCACLVGTIANVRGCDIDALGGLEPDADRPAERWFLRLRPGMTPLNSPDAAITAAWIEAWLREREVGS